MLNNTLKKYLDYRIGDLVKVVEKSNWAALPVGTICLIVEYYDTEWEMGYRVKDIEDEKGRFILYQDEIEKIG